MSLLASWPSIVDDDGTKQFGTIINKSVTDAIKASVEDNVHSTNNSGIKTKAIIDEVVTARGSRASLDERLDVLLNEDGTIKAPSSLITLAQARTMMLPSIVVNGDLLVWHGSGSPMGWTISGVGAAIAQTGTGMGDTQRMKYGDYAAKITTFAVAARITQKLLSTAAFARSDGFKGRKVSFGAYVKASNQNAGRLVVDDGATTTPSSFHTGDDTVQFLTVTHTIDSAATKLDIYCENATPVTVVYFGDICGVVSDVAPIDYVACPMESHEVTWFLAGNVTTGTDKLRWLVREIGIVTDVQLSIKTAPTGQALIVDVNNLDGAGAFSTMFATRPQIAAGAFLGGAAPDGSYARRCLQPIWGTSAPPANGYALSLDVDQIGSGAPGADLTISARYRSYQRVLAGLMNYNDVGI